MTAIAEATAPYALDAEQGVTDLWWPYGPAVGRYIVKAAAEQTGGRMVQMVVRDSRGAGTPLHTHLDADESFYVISGELVIHVGDERFEARAGDYVFAPMGIPHAFSVKSENAELFGELRGSRNGWPARHRRGRVLQGGRDAGRPGRSSSAACDARRRRVRAPDGGVRDRARRPATCPLTERVPGWSGSGREPPHPLEIMPLRRWRLNRAGSRSSSSPGSARSRHLRCAHAHS